MFRLPSPKIDLRKLRIAVVTILAIGLSFSGGYFLGRRGFVASVVKFPTVTISREVPPERDLDFSLFWRTWDTLEANFFDRSKLVPSEMVYGAIKGMVNAIDDPYTVFLPPKENRVVQEDLKGSFEGIGIQIGFRGNQLAVVSPLPDSPAEKAGVLAGDYIIGIKDELKEIDRGTVGITLPDLTLLRNESEEPIAIDIVRASIDIPSLILDFVGPNENIAHIKLLKFGGETKTEWERAVRTILKKRNLTGIILDVRNNPGGYLQGSVDVASEFLRNGSVVVIEEKSNGEKDEFKVERIGRFPDTPVVVLVNKGSASASEILAGALRDIRGIQLVGEQSFGKGTIQEPQQIENGAGLHITVARWLTPSGFWVNEGGLEPDVVLEDNPETTEDEQLQEAIRLLTGN
jgi:carboxyl-terminal processing protease